MTEFHRRFISLAIMAGALISHPSSGRYFTQPNQSIPVKRRGKFKGWMKHSHRGK